MHITASEFVLQDSDLMAIPSQNKCINLIHSFVSYSMQSVIALNFWRAVQTHRLSRAGSILSSQHIVRGIPRMDSTVWVSRQYEANIKPFASSCWYFHVNSFLLFLSLNILPTASYLLVNTIIVWLQILAFQTKFMRPMITHMMITLLRW